MVTRECDRWTKRKIKTLENQMVQHPCYKRNEEGFLSAQTDRFIGMNLKGKSVGLFRSK